MNRNVRTFIFEGVEFQTGPFGYKQIDLSISKKEFMDLYHRFNTLTHLQQKKVEKK